MAVIMYFIMSSFLSRWWLCCSYLQQSGQLAVSVVDVLVAVLLTQSVDAVTQSQQRAVDVGAFL